MLLGLTIFFFFNVAVGSCIQNFFIWYICIYFYVLDRYSFIFVWMLYKAVRVLCCRESHARELHASCKPERVSQSNLLCMMHFELLRNAVFPPFFSYIKLFSFLFLRIFILRERSVLKQGMSAEEGFLWSTLSCMQFVEE